MSEGIKVKRKVINGIQYLIDKDNNLFDADTQEHIGVYNPDTKEIIPVESDEEEELDEVAYAEKAKQKARDKMYEDDTTEKFKVSIGDFPAWKRLPFYDVPNSYWNIDLWDYGDMLDYEDKKRFIFVSKEIPISEDIDYELVVKKNGKELDPIGVIISDTADEEMLFFHPKTDYHMFLQYFGNGSEEIDNLLATGFIADDEEEPETKVEAPKVDVNLEKRKEMEDVLKQLGDLYTRLKKAYQDEPTEAKLQEAQKAKKILQKKKQEYIDFVNSLDEDATRTQPTRVRFGTGIDNPELYEKAKLIADNLYDKPSAYKSGFIVKTYKELGGTYSGNKPEKTGISRWFKEEWKDIGNKEYPVYRPTKRITKETPLTPQEIQPSNLRSQIVLKQKIKGNENLPPFLKKGTGGKVVSLGQPADKISQYDEVYKWSNPKRVQELAKKYLGEGATIFRSIKKDKKYMVYNPNTEKWVHFGQINYEDFTKHKDEKRRKNYLTRTANMRGNWKDDKYSANNLSRNLLW